MFKEYKRIIYNLLLYTFIFMKFNMVTYLVFTRDATVNLSSSTYNELSWAMVKCCKECHQLNK